MGPRLMPRVSKMHVLLVRPWFRVDSGKILLNREEISQIDQMAHFLEEIFELGSAHPAQPLTL